MFSAKDGNPQVGDKNVAAFCLGTVKTGDIKGEKSLRPVCYFHEASNHITNCRLQAVLFW